MKAFIKKHQYNYIKKCSNDLNNTFRNCVDINIIETTKVFMNMKILNLFTNLSEEEKELLDITRINDPIYINMYLAKLKEYVYGMPSITKSEIKKLFKKEKKFKLPDPNTQNSNNVYLGWIDESIKKLFVVYNMNDKPIGMACRILNHSSNNTHVCSLCNRVGTQYEIGFVSPICKTSNTSKDAYRSIGFNICLDSKECNERITSVEKLEKILKNVNNIK